MLIASTDKKFVGMKTVAERPMFYSDALTESLSNAIDSSFARDLG